MGESVPQIKLLTIGDSGKYVKIPLEKILNNLIKGVGKSWLLMRWAGDGTKLRKDAPATTTVGIDFKMKSIMIDGKRVKVQVVSIFFDSFFVFIVNKKDFLMLQIVLIYSGIQQAKKDIKILQNHIIVILMELF
jgi:GTPase SAR1 family protein